MIYLYPFPPPVESQNDFFFRSLLEISLPGHVWMSCFFSATGPADSKQIEKDAQLYTVQVLSQSGVGAMGQ